MRTFYISGVAGTGKSTVLDELLSRGYKGFDVDMVGVCGWFHKETKEKGKYKPGIGAEWVKAHDYLCDIKRLKEEIKKQKSDIVFVAGITSNQKDFLALFEKVFLLHTDKEVIFDRLKNRTGPNQFGKKEEDRKDTAWYQEFESDMIKLGAMPIESSISVKEIADKIEENIR